jgi:hypothetical protein
MLDSPEGVCPGQARFEYPATSVLFSNFDPYGRARPAGMAVRTAVPCIADTEEVTGSNPVAPTHKALTSGNAGEPMR